MQLSSVLKMQDSLCTFQMFTYMHQQTLDVRLNIDIGTIAECTQEPLIPNYSQQILTLTAAIR